VDTCRSSRQNTSSTSQPKSTSRRVSFRDDDTFNKVVAAIAAGNSVIVLGEAGTGKNDFALAVHEELSGEFNSAIATYKGSIKKFFIAIAMQLDCPTENDEGKAMTVDALKEEILVNSGEDTLLVFPESKQISKSRLAELQPLAGRNPMLARKIIKNEALGLKQEKPEHTQYVVKL
jgi:hypothetical protein